MDIKWNEIPIFIISYNRLDTLKQCINKYEQDGYTKIYVIDNASDDKDLLVYLQNLKYKVYFLDQNWGPYVLWKCRLFDDIIHNEYYVVTDPDILPVEECPTNYISLFFNILQRYPEKVKAGFSLKIDDIPESYEFKYDIIRFESFYWEKRLPFEQLIYDAPIDTTFALYRPGNINPKNFFNAVRTGYPYIARHLGWYMNTYHSFQDSSSTMVHSTSFNSKAIKLFQYKVISNLISQQTDDLFLVLKKCLPNDYIKRYASVNSLLKLFVYILLKKIALKLKK